MPIKIKLITAFVFGFLFSFKQITAQTDTSFKTEIKFIQHLINIDDQQAALQELTKLSSLNSLKNEQLDSIYYFFGWIHYNKKQLDTSSYYFKKVKLSSPLYFKSSFYESFNYAYTNQYKKAYASLTSINTDSVFEFSALKRFELAGVSLLKRDFVDFEKWSSEFRGDYYPVSENEKLFKEYYNDLKNRRKKSPLLAGTFSAFLPGTGKFYTGFKGEGATAMLTVLSLGVLAAESFYRAGPRSPQFIAFTGLFSVFYIGNIWGSITSVKKRNDAYNKELDRNILLDMHMPLRRVFN
jgi:TM2 domain-containing membrane protein YozV